MDCSVCKVIENIRQGGNPYFVSELETGYVVIGDYQYFHGYTVFICKECATELHHLEPEFRMKFLYEMSLTAEAVSLAFQPDKLNYELLGVGSARHMHWHIFPRREGDTPRPGPTWMVPAEKRCADSTRPEPEELERLKQQLKNALERVCVHATPYVYSNIVTSDNQPG